MVGTSKVLWLAVGLALASVVAGCGQGRDRPSAADTSQPGTDAAGGVGGELTVAAAASLTESFEQIAGDFEAANPGASIELTFDSSGTLSTQILQGAPVGVFASADEQRVAEVADEGLVEGEPVTFARNELVIVTKPGNPEGIERLGDLAGAGVISLCAETAPCGALAADALEAAGVTLDEGSITRGQNAKATLAAVTEGDAVAAIVYVTDAEAAGDAAEAVEIPPSANVVADYPIAVLTEAADRDLAEAFVAWVISDEGQAVLAEHGFLPPA